jgi:hypothetical protein
MEAVRRIVEGSQLSNVIPLPHYFRNRKLEIIVIPAEDSTDSPLPSRNEIDAMLEGSLTQTLIGSVPNTERTLEDYRAERLSKYERID